MRVLFFNHKFQAFYISFLMFLPLMALFLHSLELLKIEPRNDETFTLAMKQFTRFSPENSPQEKLVQEESLKPLPKPIKHIKKERHRMVQKIESFPLPNPNPQNQSAQTENPPKESIQNLSYGKDNNPFLEELKRAIERMQDYPPFARKMHMQGVVVVQFLWLESKRISELRVVRSSGHEVLDEGALGTIQRASVYFPAYHKDARITVPISYTLKR